MLGNEYSWVPQKSTLRHPNLSTSCLPGRQSQEALGEERGDRRGRAASKECACEQVYWDILGYLGLNPCGDL